MKRNKRRRRRMARTTESLEHRRWRLKHYMMQLMQRLQFDIVLIQHSQQKEGLVKTRPLVPTMASCVILLSTSPPRSGIFVVNAMHGTTTKILFATYSSRHEHTNVLPGILAFSIQQRFCSPRASGWGHNISLRLVALLLMNLVGIEWTWTRVTRVLMMGATQM